METPRKLPLYQRLLYPGLRLFFHLLYHRFSWTYDFVAATVSVGQWNTWVRSVVPYVAGPRLLELGHGPGHLQAALHAAGAAPGAQAGEGAIRQVFGLDRSPQMGRQARRRLQKRGFQPALVNGSALALPYPAGTFDTLVATFPTEYILHADTLKEAHRVLVPGGRMVVLAGAWITGKGPLQRMAALLFKLTGQAPTWDDRALDPPRRAGFETRLEWLDLPTSRLLIVIAQKRLFGS